MDHYNAGTARLAENISSMSESEVCQFIRRESREGRLSKAVRSLNRDAMSDDSDRRRRAEAAIRKLGFI